MSLRRWLKVFTMSLASTNRLCGPFTIAKGLVVLPDCNPLVGYCQRDDQYQWLVKK